MQRLNKRQIVTQHAKGHSFLDMGGLWGTKGEMVTSAAKGGASSLAIGDIMQPGTEWWRKMDAHLASHGIENYGQHQLDLMDRSSVQSVNSRFDFVHCSGILYHVVDVFECVANLLSMTDRYLLLGSVVVPEEVLGFDGALCAAAAAPEQSARVNDWLADAGLKARGVSVAADYVDPQTYRPLNGPWWWLFTAPFMSRMMQSFNVKIVMEGQYSDHAYMILVEKT
jgi:hypothetical protein